MKSFDFTTQEVSFPAVHRGCLYFPLHSDTSYQHRCTDSLMNNHAHGLDKEVLKSHPNREVFPPIRASLVNASRSTFCFSTSTLLYFAGAVPWIGMARVCSSQILLFYERDKEKLVYQRSVPSQDNPKSTVVMSSWALRCTRNVLSRDPHMHRISCHRKNDIYHIQKSCFLWYGSNRSLKP